jgi:hypothetical protein
VEDVERAASELGVGQHDPEIEAAEAVLAPFDYAPAN